MPYGTGLDTAFNQDEPQQNINTHPKKVKTPEGLKNDVKRSVDYDKIQHLKVGETVAYSKGQGTIIRKDGAYVTIFNEDANAHDQVHAGETYIPGDTISMGIMNQLWDQMNYETRMASLHKAEVQEPLHFIDRKWNELPTNLKEVIQKKSPTYTSVGSGYQGGKRPTSIGGDKQQERSAYNPGQGYSGGGGTSRTFTPGGKKTKPKENLGPESKRTPAGEGAGSAADAAAARSTGKKPGKPTGDFNPAQAGLDIMTAKPSKKDPGAGTFAQGLDKANNYGELATEIYKIRNQLNKFTGAKIPGEKLGDLPQGKNRLKPVVPGQTKIETSEGEKKLESPANRYGGSQIKQNLGGKEDPFDKKLIGGVEKTKPKENPTFDESWDTNGINGIPYGKEGNKVGRNQTGHPAEIGGSMSSRQTSGTISRRRSNESMDNYCEVNEHPDMSKINDITTRKSDVEHGAYGGVVTDTKFDAEGDYEEDKRDVHGKEFDHNHQQKTPRNPKEDGEEVIVGYHSKEGMSTGTPGANNPTYDEEKERSSTNKNNTRYGIRKASKEDIERLSK